MKRDFITGMIFSVLIHGGFATYARFFPPVAPGKVAKAPDLIVKRIEMPPLEPDKPEPPELKDEPVAAAPLAPPMQSEPVVLRAVTDFIQPRQAPPVDGPRIPTLTIPEGRTGIGGDGSLEIFDPGKLDQQPRATFQTRPVYPFEMRQAGITGEVVVGFVVDAAGNVQGAYVINSSQREFEAAAVQAVSKWKFKPGRRGGGAVATRMQVPMRFSISGDL